MNYAHNSYAVKLGEKLQARAFAQEYVMLCLCLVKAIDPGLKVTFTGSHYYVYKYCIIDRWKRGQNIGRNVKVGWPSGLSVTFRVQMVFSRRFESH